MRFHRDIRPDEHIHDLDTKRPLVDARGIFCGYVCGRCDADVSARFRPEVFADPNYEKSEPIEEC